mmetsp:Transcript_43669/g.76553  ORF Transcript_43669/g.76553 Transcript_43669/m.76553 type:complete len:395 (-) Transcript_43669:47-1231(-)
MDASSGLARKVRTSTESDEFDLGGHTKDQCEALAKAAFTEPLPLKQMVRISFVVGAGKLSRQKYRDDLPRDFCGALESIGFNDDKAASCELSSAGSYKFQHDTSKNLKFVHVFPRVAPPAAEEGEEAAEGPAENVRRDPADVLAECDMATFRRMVDNNVQGYALKRRVLDALKSRLASLEAAEQKLIARELLGEEEQRLYDTLSAEGLKEKAQILTRELQAHIDAAELTAAEQRDVLAQLDGKLKDLEAQLAKASAEGKAKMQAKLEEQREKLRATKATVSDAKPAPGVPLKHGPEIRKYRAKLAGLAKLEREASGKYTLDELKRLGEKPELEEAISVLEARARMWFETDEEFQERVQKCLREAPARKPAPGGYPAASAGNRSNDGWSTVKKKR